MDAEIDLPEGFVRLDVLHPELGGHNASIKTPSSPTAVPTAAGGAAPGFDPDDPQAGFAPASGSTRVTDDFAAGG